MSALALGEPLGAGQGFVALEGRHAVAVFIFESLFQVEVELLIRAQAVLSETSLRESG